MYVYYIQPLVASREYRLLNEVLTSATFPTHPLQPSQEKVPPPSGVVYLPSTCKRERYEIHCESGRFRTLPAFDAARNRFQSLSSGYTQSTSWESLWISSLLYTQIDPSFPLCLMSMQMSFPVVVVCSNNDELSDFSFFFFFFFVYSGA